MRLILAAAPFGDASPMLAPISTGFYRASPSLQSTARSGAPRETKQATEIAATLIEE